MCYSTLQRWFATLFAQSTVRTFSGLRRDAIRNAYRSSRKVSVIFSKIHKILQYQNFMKIRSAFNGLSYTHRRTQTTISIHVPQGFLKSTLNEAVSWPSCIPVFHIQISGTEHDSSDPVLSRSLQMKAST